MQNPNTLVSLAYIKTNSNPLSVFCNYVLYLLLTAPDQSLRSDELKQKLADRFGLNMPQQMINNCIRILKRSGDVIQLPAGAGYSIGTTNFNADTFEKNLLRLQEQEIAVLQSIVAFVYDTYKINWSVDDAKNYLSAFLDEEGNGARLFLYESAQTDSKKVSPSWYIARYVSNMQQKEDGIEKKYLEDIVNGMMIYQGIYQTNDCQQNKGQKFKGTVFYLDTKLILRALGYSWDAQVQATRELITLITKKYEGKVGVFQQTVSEVENALSRAGYNYTHGKPIMDLELKMYAELNPTGASLLSEASTSVLAQLKKEFDIDPPASFDWNTSECKAHSIDVQGIINYIKSEHEWRSGAISNDVEIINQINILRKSDYSIRYGGKSKLPVFLTTNTDLVFTLRKYISETLESGATTKWNIHALPIISDNMVLFRLWVPYANEYTNLPSLTLSRYAYAAQNPNTQFFEKLRATATAYKDEKGVDLINLSEVRRQQLEDILVTKTQGDSDELTEEMVALSVEELIKMQNISLHSRIGNLEGKIGAQNTEIEKRDIIPINLFLRYGLDTDIIRLEYSISENAEVTQINEYLSSVFPTATIYNPTLPETAYSRDMVLTIIRTLAIIVFAYINIISLFVYWLIRQKRTHSLYMLCGARKCQIVNVIAVEWAILSVVGYVVFLIVQTLLLPLAVTLSIELVTDVRVHAAFFAILYVVSMVMMARQIKKNTKIHTEVI